MKPTPKQVSAVMSAMGSLSAAARMAKITPARRKQIAQAAAKARWAKDRHEKALEAARDVWEGNPNGDLPDSWHTDKGM